MTILYLSLKLYLLLKFLVETLWCAFGLRIFRSEGPRSARDTLKYGFLRLAIGRGTMLLLSGTFSRQIPEAILFGILVLMRWPEWSLMNDLIAGRKPSARGLLMAGDAASYRWRAGGVLVSSVADLAALLLGIRVDELWG
jgi:hypothetical protein